MTIWFSTCIVRQGSSKMFKKQRLRIGWLLTLLLVQFADSSYCSKQFLFYKSLLHSLNKMVVIRMVGRGLSRNPDTRLKCFCYW